MSDFPSPGPPKSSSGELLAALAQAVMGTAPSPLAPWRWVRAARFGSVQAIAAQPLEGPPLLSIYGSAGELAVAELTEAGEVAAVLSVRPELLAAQMLAAIDAAMAEVATRH